MFMNLGYEFLWKLIIALDFLTRMWDTYSRYGVATLATGRRCRHAAYGRARRGVVRVANSHRTQMGDAAVLLANLREERYQLNKKRREAMAADIQQAINYATHVQNDWILVA